MINERWCWALKVEMQRLTHLSVAQCRLPRARAWAEAEKAPYLLISLSLAEATGASIYQVHLARARALMSTRWRCPWNSMKTSFPYLSPPPHASPTNRTTATTWFHTFTLFSSIFRVFNLSSHIFNSHILHAFVVSQKRSYFLRCYN